MVILEKITEKKFPTVWLVGKWITFDTGWLNIKVEDHMYGMKDDMAGSSTLLFTMKELDEKDQLIELIYQNRSTVRKLIDLDTMDNSKLFEALMRRMKIYLTKKSYI